MEQKQQKLIKEEQKELDRLIKRMDTLLFSFDKHLTQAQLRMKKHRGWEEAYGAFLDAKHDGIRVREDISKLTKSRNALYTMRVELECEELDGSGKKDTEDLKIGLHTYVHNGELFIISWKMPVCRHFMFNDNAEEYIGSVYQTRLDEHYRTHYQLKMKRRIDLEFDEVTDVLQMFPLTEEEEQIIVDRFLQDLLKRREEQEFKNIVFSIQKRQGEIIQVPYYQNLIVQGCAGSGKSMIMLHRLPILLEDNHVVLSKNNIYVITPSEAYIQMMAGLREDLELEDLRMGTIVDYYRYSIERYGKRIEGCGRINPLLKLSKDKQDFIYTDYLMPKSIEWRLQSAIKAGYVDTSEGRRILGVGKRVQSPDSYREIIRSEVLSIQDLISKNEESLRAYSGAYKQVIQALREVEQTLRTRKLAEERRILREIEQLRSDIKTQESEIAKLDKVVNYRAVKNRYALIQEAQKKIEEEQQRLLELPDDQIYSGLERFASQILKYWSTINIGPDPDDQRDQYKTDRSYRQAKEKYLEDLYRIISSKEEIQDTVLAIGMQLYDLTKGDLHIETSYSEQLDAAQNAAARFKGMTKPYLQKEYYDELNKSSVYYNKLLDNAEMTTYMSIMNFLGYKEDKRGRLFVPVCAPYVYLKVLSIFNGPLGNNRESLIAVDEAQNYTVEELKLLKEINGGTVVFNLFGDIKQRIEGEKGISNWSEVAEVADFQTYYLRENYRNALQITNECNRRFGMEMEAINVNGTGVTEYKEEGDFETVTRKKIRHNTGLGLACVIFKYPSEVRQFIKNLSDENDQIHDLTQREKELSRSLWNVMTVDQVKGLEFNTVIAVTGRMTDNEKYLTFTRALDELIIFDKEYGETDPVIDTTEESSSSEDGKGSDKEPVGEKLSGGKTDGENQDGGKKVAGGKPLQKKKPQSKLVKFFTEKGLEVVDKRQTSGLLWVIGPRDQIMSAVREGCRKFRISGQFGKSQDTGGRQGWYTKSNL